MKEVLKSALTIWYFLLSMIFLFATMLSIGVLLGLWGDGPDYAPWVGAGCTCVFWYAGSKYRKLFLGRIEEIHKNSDRFKDWDDDERN